MGFGAWWGGRLPREGTTFYVDSWAIDWQSCIPPLPPCRLPSPFSDRLPGEWCFLMVRACFPTRELWELVNEASFFRERQPFAGSRFPECKADRNSTPVWLLSCPQACGWKSGPFSSPLLPHSPRAGLGAAPLRSWGRGRRTGQGRVLCSLSSGSRPETDRRREARHTGPLTCALQLD